MCLLAATTCAAARVGICWHLVYCHSLTLHSLPPLLYSLSLHSPSLHSLSLHPLSLLCVATKFTCDARWFDTNGTLCTDSALDKDLFSIVYAVPKSTVKVPNSVDHVPFPSTLPSNDVPATQLSYLQVNQESRANRGSLVFFKPNHGASCSLDEIVPVAVVTQVTTII